MRGLSEQVARGLILAFWKMLIDCPWLIVGIIPFWDKLRVKKRTMVIWIAMVNGLFCLGNFIAVAFVPRSTSVLLTNTILPIAYYACIVIFFIRGVNVYWGQLLYVFLFIYSTSTFINNTSLMVNQLFLGMDTVITVLDNPTFPLGITLLNLVFFPFIIGFFRKTLRPALSNISKRDTWILCILPLMFMFVNVYAIFSNSFKYFEGTALINIYIFIQISWVASFFVNLLLMKESRKSARLQAENNAIGQMVALQQSSYAQLAENIERTRRQRHDMRFHISVLSGYLREGDYKSLGEYLDEYGQGLEENAIQPMCRQHTVDILARHFIGEMKYAGASVEVRLDIPPQMGISDAELSVIFGNLLENASNSIALQGQDAFFKAKCYVENDMLIILMQNSCIEEEKAFKPGIGLNSVKALAEEHGGFAQFDCYDGIFNAHVALKTK